MAELDDKEKLQFSEASIQLKREVDQNLRAFKEFIDLEENRKGANNQQKKISHQDMRLMQEIASLMMLIKTYHLKQVDKFSENGLFGQPQVV